MEVDYTVVSVAPSVPNHMPSLPWIQQPRRKAGRQGLTVYLICPFQAPERGRKDLAKLLDLLLRNDEDDFEVRKPFFLGARLGDQPTLNARVIGGAIESRAWSYVFVCLVGCKRQFQGSRESSL
jgi:hypothetical protein